jgi:UPF0755 protein
VKRLLTFAVAAAVAFGGWAFLVPYKGFDDEVFIEIPHGTSAAGIGAELARAGVIRYPWQFLLARAIRPSAKLRAGEYRFTKPASVREVFSRIAMGDIFYFEFTVPEGSNIFDIARLLQEQGIMNGDDFLNAASDPSPIRDLAPDVHTLEGFLFPATYRISHSTTAAQLCKMMTDEFRKQWSRVSALRQANPERTVTLASLIEKETGSAEERPLVASVFTNRLAKGMRLECDPTAIYAALLENRYHGKIHRSDLASANPYNTYQNAGLPPGPIANPGLPSIEAALDPAPTQYLYFVAKPGGGGHQFSTNMEAHAKAVVAYRHANRKQSQAAAKNGRPPAVAR